jgi:hypothetical protein
MTDGEAAFRSAIDLLRPAGPTRLLQTALKELSELLATQKRHEEANTLLREALNTQH